MGIQKQFTSRLSYVILTFCFILFFSLSCKKDGYSNKCLTCTAKYSSGLEAGREEACGEAEQRAFKEKYNYANTWECK
jgi:hypothetical protein